MIMSTSQNIRRWVIISLLTGVLLGGAGMLLHTYLGGEVAIFDARTQKNVTVVLTDTGFVPQNIRILKGATVTFSTTRESEFWPASNPHPSHFLLTGFDPKAPIPSGDTWSYTFRDAGVWGYHDHVRSYFVGIVYVE